MPTIRRLPPRPDWRRCAGPLIFVSDVGGVSADGTVPWLTGRYSIGDTGIMR